MAKSTTHIRVTKSEACENVVVCGAPERAEWIASLMEGSRALHKNREYHSYRGKWKGVDILVISHGVGAGGASICFQELIDLSVKKIVRVGTAGGLQSKCQIGDVVVATSAIRREGVSRLMMPLEFPAVPDFELTQRLVEQVSKLKIKFYDGIVLSTDLFYAGLLPTDYDLFQKANTIAVEMECSALFIIGTLRKVRTASVLCLDGNPMKKAVYDPNAVALKKGLHAAITATLETLSVSL